MNIKHLVAGLVIAGTLGACSKGGSGDIDAFMKMDTEKAAAFSAGGKDCAVKAKSAGEWRTKNSAEYKKLRQKLNDQWPKGPPDDVKEKYGTVMQANKKAVVEAMMDCSNDPTFSKMMDDTKAAE